MRSAARLRWHCSASLRSAPARCSSSCTLGPAIAAMSLIVAGPALLGLRLGRNARFASIGNGIGAALMGACGYYVSERAVFFLTAAVTLPALASLWSLTRLRDP